MGPELRDPDLFRQVPGITEEEMAALEKEPKSSFWQQSKTLKLIIMTCSIAAILQYVLNHFFVSHELPKISYAIKICYLKSLVNFISIFDG